MKRRRSEERDAGSQHSPLQNGYGRPAPARLGRSVMASSRCLAAVSPSQPPAHVASNPYQHAHDLGLHQVGLRVVGVGAGTGMSRVGRASALCTGALGALITCVRHHTRIGLRRTATAVTTTRIDTTTRAACSTAEGASETLPVAAAGFRTLAEAEAATLSLVVGGLAASVAEGMRSGEAASTTAAEAGCDIHQNLDQDLGRAFEAGDVVDRGSTRGEPFKGVAAFTSSVAEAETA